MKKVPQGLEIGICIALGAALGVVFGNISIGAGLGIVFWVVFNASQNKKQ